MPARPKGFQTCYICQREFGSRSIQFHEPQCLEKWKNENNRLPQSQRGPVPRKNIFGDVEATSNVARQSERRPRTATLTHPKILNIGDVNRVDMSMVAANHRQRPKTFKLNGPSPNVKIPSVVAQKTSTNATRSPTKAQSNHRYPHSNNGPTKTFNVLNGNHARTANGGGPANKMVTSSVGDDYRGTGDPKFGVGKIKSIFPSKHTVAIGATSLHHYVVDPLSPAYFPEVATPPPPPEPCHSCRASNLGSPGALGNKNAVERLHSHPKKPQLHTHVHAQDRGTARHQDATSHPYPSGNVTSHTSGANANGNKRIMKILSENDGQFENQGHYDKQNVAHMLPNKTKSPQLLTCPVCERQFSSKVFQNHQLNCLQKLHQDGGNQVHLVERSGQRPPTTNSGNTTPPTPRAATATATPESANHVRRGPSSRSFPTSLLPCSACGRTFFPERLVVHQRVCQNKLPDQITSQGQKIPAEPQEADEQQVSPRSSGVQAPRFAICYICGREFGSKSIAIHEPQCLKKWNQENEKLPKRLRRTEPLKPETMLNSDGTVDLAGLADAAWKSHLEQLIPCPNCKRTFNPDRLEVHLRVCRVPNK